MKLKNIRVQNFRLLNDVTLTVDDKSTVIVGRNNSGKTSLTEIFRRFFSDSKSTKLKLEDFSAEATSAFLTALKLKNDKADEDKIRSVLPEIKLTLEINYEENKDSFGSLSHFIIDLDDSITTTVISISFKLKGGKIEGFFFELEKYKGNINFFELLKDRIDSYYDVEILAVDPTDSTNTVVIERSKLIEILGLNFINAQRGLDDETHTERDMLGKILGSIFKSSSSMNAPDDMKVKTKELQDAIQEIQDKVDVDVSGKIEKLLPELNIFGYPGLSDPNITTKTTFDAQTIVDQNTKVLYDRTNQIPLPETYNGLGSRNLIYILFKLFEFFRRYQSMPTLFKGHLIFIEEPEAHLHPQMQEVFVRKLYDIAESFSKKMNNGVSWPVQFIVSTHSTHIANEARFDSIRYFHTEQKKDITSTTIKDLGIAFSEKEKDDKDFLHKYLTLTKCDLFFADKVILIEGATERILMPKFIEKTNDGELSSQYISIIEVGGAYAHRFYKFLNFIELKTVIITDLDSVKKGEKRNVSCPVHEGEKSSNAGLKNWFDPKGKGISLTDIQKKTDAEKINGKIRIAFQTPVGDKLACGRSFEDALMIENPSIFEIVGSTKEEIETFAYEKAKEISDNKANFAIEYAIDKTSWTVPKYISEGLVWLAMNDEISKVSS